MTFKQYCKTVVGEDSIEGDFAYDVLQDKSFPRTSKNRKPKSIQYKLAIKNYLDDKHACIAATEAFESLWKSYFFHEEQEQSF